MSNSINVKSFVEKLNSTDFDLRYMGLNDLAEELVKPSFSLDHSSEAKLVDKVLELLNDVSGEVKGVAVDCLGVFIQHVSDATLANIITTLIDGLVDGKDDQREMSATALKKVVYDLPSDQAALLTARKVVDLLAPSIIKAVDSENVQVKLEALDLLHDLLRTYSQFLVDLQDSIVDVLLPQLHVTRQAVRKRAIVCLGPTCSLCREDLFNVLCTDIIEQINKSSKQEMQATFVQSMGTIARFSGYRAGRFFKSCVPTILDHVLNTDADEDEDDELREVELMTLESFVRKAPKDITPFIPRIVDACVEYIAYDPNYVDDDDDDSADEYSDDEYSDDEYDDDVYSDDADVSWKVRLACSKTLCAIISSRPELLSTMYHDVCPLLIQRFKEREENVKLDIFHTFAELLHATNTAVKYSSTGSDYLDMLRSRMDRVAKVLPKLLNNKSFKTRQGTFNMLRELTQVLPGALEDCVGTLAKGITTSLEETANGCTPLKIDTLLFTQALITHNNATSIQPHLGTLCPPVYACVGESFFKIIAEALRVCQLLIDVMSPVKDTSGEVEMGDGFDYAPFAQDLFDAVYPRLEDQQLDQEVKECAITAVGLIVARLSSGLSSGVDKALTLLADRLNNEITRLSAVKAFATIATSPSLVDVSAVLTDVVSQLALFLRKSDRPLKINTLAALDAIVQRYSADVGSLVGQILDELSPLVSDEDLHLSHLAVKLAVSILRADPSSVGAINETIVPNVLSLLRSPLLQGAALRSVLSLFEELLRTGDSSVSFDALLAMVLDLSKQARNGKTSVAAASSSANTSGYSRQSLSSIAKCIAVLCKNASQSQVQGTMSSFVADLSADDEATQLMAMLSIGETGLLVDLSDVDGVFATVLAAFDSQSEEVKTAASFALGGLTVGSLKGFLPLLLEEIQASPKRQYLLLHSLKEIISRQAADLSAIENYFDSLLDMLYAHCESKEEGTRNVVAECLGRVALLNPSKMVDSLEGRLADSSANTRATVVTSIRFLVTEDGADDEVIMPLLTASMKLIGDSDLNVRRATLMTLNFVIHNKVTLIHDELPGVLPQVYAETEVKEELKRKVVVGPFTRTVDDGLDLRKAAFSVMNTLLARSVDVLDMPEFLQHVTDGLGDEYDIKTLSHSMVQKLCSAAPVAVLESLSAMVPPLKETVNQKMKKNAIQQEIEKNEETIKSALRCTAALRSLEDADSNEEFVAFVNEIEADEKLSATLAEVSASNQADM